MLYRTPLTEVPSDGKGGHMRKHGTNRPSIAAIAAISALLVTSLGGSALAGKGGTPTGSSSNNGNAVYLVDYDERGCNGGTVNTSDNYITDDGTMYMWVKSSDIAKSNLPDNWIVQDKGKTITNGTFYACCKHPLAEVASAAVAT